MSENTTPIREHIKQIFSDKYVIGAIGSILFISIIGMLLIGIASNLVSSMGTVHWHGIAIGVIMAVNFLAAVAGVVGMFIWAWAYNLNRGNSQ
jgi:type III secretory pathway component EscU